MGLVESDVGRDQKKAVIINEKSILANSGTAAATALGGQAAPIEDWKAPTRKPKEQVSTQRAALDAQMEEVRKRKAEEKARMQEEEDKWDLKYNMEIGAAEQEKLLKERGSDSKQP